MNEQTKPQTSAATIARTTG